MADEPEQDGEVPDEDWQRIVAEALREERAAPRRREYEEIGWDPKPSTSLRQLFRYRKGARIRTYGLRAVSAAGEELWVVTEGGGQERKSRRLMTLTDPKDSALLLESIEQELRAGGWLEY